MVKDMTKGSPIKLILSFGLPLIIGSVLQQLYNMVDSIVVGQFVGKNALAGVGSTASLYFLIIGFTLGTCTGFSIPISQYFGAGDYDRMRKCLANLIYLSVFIATVITILTLCLTRWILAVMNTPADIFEDAYTYIIIIFGGIFATMFYNMLASVLRAIGDSKTPLYFLIISAVLNFILALLFVVYFSMGVMGAATATVISQLFSGILCLIHIKRKLDILHLKKDDMKLNLRLCSKLLYMGLPMGFQFSITAIGSIMLQFAVNSLGSDIVAAVTIAAKVQLLLIVPCESIGITMATFCGQNLGAGKIKRISQGVRQGFYLALIYSCFAFLIGHYAGSYISLLFLNKSEVVVLAYVAKYLKYSSFFYPILGILFIFRNSLQGLGYSVPAMAAGVFELAARSLFGFLVVPMFGFTAVCFANPAAWIAADILLIPVYYYFMHKLKVRYENKITQKNEIHTKVSS